MTTTFENMDIEFEKEIPLQTISLSILEEKKVFLQILRLDEIHQVISGNKWFKLKENIAIAKQQKKNVLLTFGGAYSNHLVATAAAAAQFHLQSIGIVRGLHAQENLTSTLVECERYGMQLYFVSKDDYAKKYEDNYINELKSKHPKAYFIPEGGNNEAGIKGTEAITNYIPYDTNIVCTAIGTGTTFCGIRRKLADSIQLLGFTAMKNGDYLHNTIQNQVGEKRNWELITNYHFGGFAKHQQTLIDFMNHMYQSNNLPLDFVYTAKTLFGILDLVQINHFPPNSKIVMIHSGGLQGNASIQKQLVY